MVIPIVGTIITIIGGFFIRRWITKLIAKLALDKGTTVLLSKTTADWVMKLFVKLQDFILKGNMKVYCVKKSLGYCTYRQPKCIVMENDNWKPEDFPNCEKLEKKKPAE